LINDSIGTVFFLAANSNVPLSVRDPLFDFRSLNCAINVIDQCRYSNVEQFIFASSGFIYGNTTNRPITEDEPLKPISPYAISKKAIEYYLAFYREVYGLSYVVLRLATVYGPRQVSGALADYIRKLAGGDQAELFGDGSKTRDYIFIDDVVEALLMSMNISDMREPIFNIGTGKETELRKAYNKVADMLGRKPEPIIQPDRPGELYGYSLSYEKANKVLGWQPRTSFDEGLRRVLIHKRLLSNNGVPNR
jgi:UDP-glucose 4-epimerase